MRKMMKKKMKKEGKTELKSNNLRLTRSEPAHY